MKKVIIMVMVCVLLAGCGVAGKFIATENKYYDEVAKAEEAVANFNDVEVNGGIRTASLETDWNNASYGITVRMYTADGVMISAVVYDSVDDFIESEF